MNNTKHDKPTNVKEKEKKIKTLKELKDKNREKEQK